MTTCLITAFMDINRSNWNNFQRSTHDYIKSFKQYLFLDHHIFVFIEDDLLEIIKEIVKDKNNFTIIPISSIYSKIQSFHYIEKENEIMNSKFFKFIMNERIEFPECSKEKYNIIQHAKIDFVLYISENYPEFEYYAWSDFGDFQNYQLTKSIKLNDHHFPKDQIMYQSLRKIKNDDINLYYNLFFAPSIICGSFFVGNKYSISIFHSLYHKILISKFHNNNIVDDDQHIVLQCYFKNPKLFSFFVHSEWHQIYKYLIL